VVRDQQGHAHIIGSQKRGRNWPGPWRKTPGRLLGTSLVRLYQLTLSGFVGNSCRHLPTCSEYAHEAIARHGLWAGGWMGFFRVLRCGPFGTHGIDRVPEALAQRYLWFTPWRYWRIGSKRGEAQADGAGHLPAALRVYDLVGLIQACTKTAHLRQNRDKRPR
jgi:putative membrane protein insertion efficiency factor